MCSLKGKNIQNLAFFLQIILEKRHETWCGEDELFHNMLLV